MNISSKQVFQTKLFHVNELAFTGKNGEKKVHHVAERLPTVTIFPLTDKNEIYLVSEYREIFGKKIISAAAGFMDKDGETPLITAKRELKEELGITANHWEEIAKIEAAASVFKGVSYLFLAQELEIGQTKQDEDEQITPVKMPLKTAVEKVFSGEITMSSSIIGILMLHELQKKKIL